VLRLLARIGRVRPVMDFDLTPAEAVADPAPPEVPFVAEVRVDAPIAEGVVGVPVTEVADPAIAVVDVQARRVGLLRDLAREAWVVGHLRLRGAGTTPQAVELLARRAVSDLMEAVARRIPALAPDSPEYERCLRSALWFASRKVAMTAAPDGRVLLDVLDPAAERILDLPLFPTTSGVATSAARLLRERVARRSGDVPEGLGTPLADRVPPWLWAWLEGLLSERRIARPASAKPVGPELAAPPARLDDKALAAWLTDSLARLRPDGATPLEIVVSPFSQADESSGGRLGLAVFAGPEARSIRLAIDGSHWLVRRARQRMAGDPEAGAWLLLACFAHLNAALEGITNQEEQVFQEHLMDLLERGELLPPAP
jgi:hypothetical protein